MFPRIVLINQKLNEQLRNSAARHIYIYIYQKENYGRYHYFFTSNLVSAPILLRDNCSKSALILRPKNSYVSNFRKRYVQSSLLESRSPRCAYHGSTSRKSTATQALGILSPKQTLDIRLNLCLANSCESNYQILS